ncbi:MAG: Crp/Fnr family transcriptional regulator [Nitrospinae bacterium]|nr:Crp/Fnr family transcriptional regulator [Nitrospinota bacterium]
MDDLELIGQINVFAGLGGDQIAEVARRLAPMRVEKGSYLFYRDDMSDGMFFVARGLFQIIIDNEANREIIVYTVGKGDILGEMSLFGEHKRSATAVALEESRLFKISNERFLDLMRTCSLIGVNMAKVLIGRLLAANEMIERLGAMDGAERIEHFLKSLLVREGSLRDDRYAMEKRPTYRQISQRLGISEKTVYRTMRCLAEKGMIHLGGKRLEMMKSFMDAHGSGHRSG